ncbi:MAG: KamA family radical SAM protein [Proteobacteria bacterium]|nr:KamA family radical SAM protein [Pseudomonadota bacterium]
MALEIQYNPPRVKAGFTAGWNNWKWQLRSRFTGIEEFFDYLGKDMAEFEQFTGKIPFAVTPFYASLIKQSEHSEKLLKTVVPDSKELELSPHEMHDPLREGEQSPCSTIVHRYPDRVLFLVTNNCATYCRYCTRSRMTGLKPFNAGKSELQAGIDYISQNKQTREVIISGGDPLFLDDKKLEWIISALHGIEHIQLIRIGTKVPVVLPQRVNDNLLGLLKKYPPIYINLHVIHPDELVPETEEAISKLVNAGCVLASQTVLLKGVNDDIDTLQSLMEKLLRNRVRPYALFNCDLVTGASHFRTDINVGLDLVEQLRKRSSGLAVPTYIVDPPGGKVSLHPSNLLEDTEDGYVLKNWAGQLVNYPK